MNLSYAEQRALDIGITIAGGANVILLDEPTAGRSKSETTRFIHLIKGVTVGRTLMGDPDLIIIDEPTEGLAPKIVELVGEYLQALKARGISVLLIEQKLTIAMTISDRTLVMGHGAIVFQGTPDSLRADNYIRKEWLEV